MASAASGRMLMRVLNGVAEVRAAVGQHLGFSDYRVVEQRDVDAFASLTGDDQWIHVDVERAKRESPFGGPVAHGFLTLSLLIPMWSQVLTVTDAAMEVNYGLNKVRFPSPVPVGGRIRLTAALTDVAEVTGGLQVTASAVIELEGGGKPACVAEPIFRFYAR
jgi:acyl dehydratase